MSLSVVSILKVCMVLLFFCSFLQLLNDPKFMPSGFLLEIFYGRPSQYIS